MRAGIVEWMAAAAVLLAIAAPAAAQTTPGATLFQVTENMHVVEGRVPHRLADGALFGTAQLGTPFCPQRLASRLPLGATHCSVTATGADNINLRNGHGSLVATIVPVAIGDNPFAAPQLILDRVSVRGTIDFSPALAGLPYGTVEGRVEGRRRFTGVFTQPFLGSTIMSGRTLRQLLCPLTPTPNPHLGGPDFAWLEITDGGPTGHCIDILPSQLVIGYPPLRFDLFFE